IISAVRRSSSSRPRGILRCVERCCPSAAQARRSETCSCAPTTTFSGVDFVPLKYRNEYMEVGGGVKAKLYDHVLLFANADYQFSVTGFRRDGVKGGAGLRYTW